MLQPGIAEITNQLEFDDEVAFLAIRKIYDYVRFEPEKPFCLMASFTHPHDPYAARKKFWDLYSDEDIDLPAVPRMERSALDPHSQRLYDVSAMDDYTVTEADLRAARHGYYANISYVDDLLGQMIAALEASGKLDDTVIVFTSDHGDFLGERGLWYKMSYLEPSAHVPFLIWNPKRFAARRVKEPVTLADILPTLTAIANDGVATLARPVDGRSLYPMLIGGMEDVNGTAWGEYLVEGAIAPIYMLRRGPWKFIHSPVDPDQLYNLDDDPLELKNLAGCKSAGSTVPRGGGGEVRHSARQRARARKPAGAADDVRGAEAGEPFPPGLPAAARCLRTIHAQPHECHGPRPEITLSACAGY